MGDLAKLNRFAQNKNYDICTSIYMSSRPKISRRFRFSSQNWAISSRFHANLNLSFSEVVFCVFKKNFQKFDLNRIFPVNLNLLRSHRQILVSMFFQKSYFLLSGRVLRLFEIKALCFFIHFLPFSVMWPYFRLKLDCCKFPKEA